MNHRRERRLELKSADLPLSIVVPAYCEGTHLAASLDKILEAGTNTGHPFEIVIVDDGSTDDTWTVIGEARASDPRIVGIRLTCLMRLSIELCSIVIMRTT